MYNGEMTEELDRLYNEYYKKFGCYPDEYDDLEYSEDMYETLLQDIKTSLDKNKEIEDLYI